MPNKIPYPSFKLKENYTGVGEFSLLWVREDLPEAPPQKTSADYEVLVDKLGTEEELDAWMLKMKAEIKRELAPNEITKLGNYCRQIKEIYKKNPPVFDGEKP